MSFFLDSYWRFKIINKFIFEEYKDNFVVSCYILCKIITVYWNKNNAIIPYIVWDANSFIKSLLFMFSMKLTSFFINISALHITKNMKKYNFKSLFTHNWKSLMIHKTAQWKIQMISVSIYTADLRLHRIIKRTQKASNIFLYLFLSSRDVVSFFHTSNRLLMMSIRIKHT